MRRLIGVVFCFLIPFAFAATTGNTNDSAGEKAFENAERLSDPAARLDAIRHFTAQYPKSRIVGYANRAILKILVKNFPNLTDEIDKQVTVLLKRAKGEDAWYDYMDVANVLAGGNVLLSRAQTISRKSITMLKEKKLVASQRKYHALEHVSVSDAELHSTFLEIHSELIATLGRIDVKVGQTSDGEVLLKAAYTEDADNSEASAELGTLAANAGRDDEALSYLTRARLTGKLEDSQQKLLEKLYADKHSASMTGFEAYLDQSYATLFPNPIQAPKFAISTKPTRTVLAELFTGSGCPPCAGADLVMDAELHRYTRKELAVIAFDQHIPEPDPLANPDSVKRFDFYQAFGTPTLALDGTTKTIDAKRNHAKTRFEEVDTLVQNDLQSPAEADIALIASRDGNRIKVRASTANIKGQWKDLKLQLVLVEDELRYSGENGIRFHRYVARSVATGGADQMDVTFDITQISSGLKKYLDEYEKSNGDFGPITFIQEMDAIDPGNLSVIAFLQDNETRHILQAAYLRLGSEQ